MVVLIVYQNNTVKTIPLAFYYKEILNMMGRAGKLYTQQVSFSPDKDTAAALKGVCED